MNTLGIRKHNRNRTCAVVILSAGHLFSSHKKTHFGVSSTLTVGVGGLAADGFGRGEHIGIGVVTVDIVGLDAFRLLPRKGQAAALCVIVDCGRYSRSRSIPAGRAHAVFAGHVVRDLHIGDGLHDI